MPIAPVIQKISNNEISIVFSCDNNYIPYLGVCIKSLIDHVDNNKHYVIYVIENGLNHDNKNKLASMCHNNIEIKFIDIHPYISNINSQLFYLCDHFSIAVYFRFFIPRIFSNFD